MHQTQSGFREGRWKACHTHTLTHTLTQALASSHTHTHTHTHTQARAIALPHESFTHGCPEWLCLLSEHIICFGVGGGMQWLSQLEPCTLN